MNRPMTPPAMARKNMVAPHEKPLLGVSAASSVSSGQSKSNSLICGGAGAVAKAAPRFAASRLWPVRLSGIIIASSEPSAVLVVDVDAEVVVDVVSDIAGRMSTELSEY